MSKDGWRAPQTDEDVSKEFFAKHGMGADMVTIDRKWRTLGKLIDKGVKIRDGRLG